MAGVVRNAHEAVQKFCAEGCKHHNPYFAEGIDSLATAMEENARQYPEKIYSVKHIIEEGDLVAVHGRVELQPGESWVQLCICFDSSMIKLQRCGISRS